MMGKFRDLGLILLVLVLFALAGFVNYAHENKSKNIVHDAETVTAGHPDQGKDVTMCGSNKAAIFSFIAQACEPEITVKTEIKSAPPHIQVALKQLKSKAGLKNQDKIKVFVEYGNMSKNASICDSGTIVITEGNVIFTKQFPNQLYFILAHELMHWKNGDLSTRYKYCDASLANSRQCEKQADLGGKKLMKAAGYDHCAGGNYWFRWLYRYGDTGKGGSHPSAKERYEYLRCY